MKKLLTLEAICAVLILVAFFILPWFDFGLFSIKGYQVPDKVKALASIRNTVSGEDEAASAFIIIKLKVFSLYLLFLSPVFSIWTIVNAMNDKSSRLISFFTAAVPLAFFIYAYAGIMENKLFQIMGIGSFLTVGAALAILLHAFGIVSSKKDLSDKNAGSSGNYQNRPPPPATPRRTNSPQKIIVRRK